MDYIERYGGQTASDIERAMGVVVGIITIVVVVLIRNIAWDGNLR